MTRSKRKTYRSYAWTHPKTGRLYARVQIKQADGKYKAILRPAQNRTHADQLATEILNEYETRREAFLDGETMTFADLATWYTSSFVVPPVYGPDGTKVSGMRTHRTEKAKIRRLIEHFGSLKIRDIREDDLTRFKSLRESTGVGVQAVNRDLETLRAIFKKAVRKRWIRESPFDFGEQLIHKALERKRDVTLGAMEEAAVLEAARQSKKSLIYYVVLCLMDTGARPSEIYDASTEKAEPVRWRDFADFNFEQVRLTSFKARHKETRIAPVSERLMDAMLELWESIPEPKRSLEEQIFRSKSYKTAWNKVRVSAGFPELRLRDLRRSFRTKMGKENVNDLLTQKIMGHKTGQTSFDYLQADSEAIAQVRQVLDRRVQSALDAELSSDAEN